jgi:Ran GTPase-activating protein (RanGAP) involved in mRNA processing and transport
VCLCLYLPLLSASLLCAPVQLDLSYNKIGRQGSERLASWLNMMRENSHLRHLYLNSTGLQFVFIGKPLVHFQKLV